jgi:hypothetical protein
MAWTSISVACTVTARHVRVSADSVSIRSLSLHTPKFRMGLSRLACTVTNREDPIVATRVYGHQLRRSFFLSLYFLYWSYKEIAITYCCLHLLLLTRVINRRVCTAQFACVHTRASKNADEGFTPRQNATEGLTPRQEGSPARHQTDGREGIGIPPLQQPWS